MSSSKRVHLNGVGDITITKRKGQKSIRLSVSGGRVAVSQPTWLPFSASEQFIMAKRDWISEHFEPKTILTEGSVIYGYTLVFKRTTSLRMLASFAESVATIFLPEGNYPQDPKTQDFIAKSLESELRNRAEDYLPKRVAFLAEQYGFRYKSVQVKKLKRRWGSCNSKKELVFNLNLVSLDPLHIDYVILHELTHTIHMNHGAEFWEHLESVFPGAKKIAKIVRRAQY